MTYFLQQGEFVLRARYCSRLSSFARKVYYNMLGMKIGTGTVLPKLYITWPNQLAIGENCTLEHSIYFKASGIWRPNTSIGIGNKVFIGTGCEFNITQGIQIGDNCLIASGCRFIDHDHGTALGTTMRSQSGPEKAIKLGSDIWLGCNVIVLKGVEIGDGAVVAAGSVVTKSILPNEIWAGVPARKIGQRNP